MKKKEETTNWIIVIIVLLILYVLFTGGSLSELKDKIIKTDSETTDESDDTADGTYKYDVTNRPTVIIVDDRIYFEQREYNAESLIDELIALDFYLPIVLVDKFAYSLTFNRFETKLNDAGISYNIKEDYD